MRFLYQFSASDSFLHRVDPRSKMLFLLVFLVSVWAVPLPYPLLMAVGAVLIIWVGADTKPTEYFSFLLFLIPIMFMVVLIQILTGPPPHDRPVIMGVRFLRISMTGLEIGTRVAFVLAAMGIVFLGFSMTTDPFHWGMSLHRMGLPYKVAYMFGFAMRFFPLLQEELATITNALRARGSETVGRRNPVQILRNVGLIVIPLGLSALSRSQTIAMAMELRGFSLPQEMGTKRTLYREIRFTWRDTVVWIASALLVIATVMVVRT